jgi:G3E family GTPase
MKIHMVGGFLGSGKTTAIISAAKLLMGQGLTVGVITNDQGKYLVDTNFMRLEEIPTVEVNGGCFCCNYTDFDQSLDKLVDQIQPDVVFAESVGSCADVVATVLQPLLQFKDKSAEDISLSVFTDARLLRAYLDGLDLPFQDGVIYVFEKQIEEANILILNKIDLLEPKQGEELLKKSQERYPDKIILNQTSLTPEGVRSWMNLLEEDRYPVDKKPLSINYQVYGAGEQVLAWYDGVYELNGNSDQVADWIQSFLSHLQKVIKTKNIPIGHLKFLIRDSKQHQKISLTGLYDLEEIQLDPNHVWDTPVILLVNARLECSQLEISQLMQSVLKQNQKEQSLLVKIVDEEAFHPGFPSPTHRLIK